MKKINFIRIEMNNFRSYFGYHDFTIDADNINVYNIFSSSNDGSSNGSGKSTLIVDSLLFCLLGKTRGKRHGLMCDKTNKNCWVAVSFYLNDDKKNIYKIRRCIRKRGDASTIYELYLNDEVVNDVTDDRKVSIDDKIKEIVNIDEQLLSNIVYNNNSEYSRFSQLSAKSKRALFEDIFIDPDDVSKLIKKHTNNKSKITHELMMLEEKYKTINESTDMLIDDLKRELDNIKTIDVTEHKKELKDKQQRLQQQKSNLQNIIKLNQLLSQSKCPTCLQPISNEHRQKIQTLSTTDVESRIEELATQCEYLSNLIVENERNKQHYDSISYQIKKIENQRKLIITEDDDDRIKKLKNAIKVLSDADQILNERCIHSCVCSCVVQYINKIISTLIFDFNMDFNFHIDSKSFDIILNDCPVPEMNVDDLSSGQRKIIDLIIMFAITKLKNSSCVTDSNIVVFDELIDSALDQKNYESCFSLISELFKDKNIFFISHRHVTLDGINKAVEIEYNNGCSSFIVN